VLPPGAALDLAVSCQLSAVSWIRSPRLAPTGQPVWSRLSQARTSKPRQRTSMGIAVRA